jgi:hypothetical protein
MSLNSRVTILLRKEETCPLELDATVSLYGTTFWTDGNHPTQMWFWAIAYLHPIDDYLRTAKRSGLRFLLSDTAT